ncbi:hypothetical protein D9611_004065 [Ephemerocybe angulata]|uniref:Fungal-type protein kinase domain-containing protein n=1 Tax=Ephemerocybe angulata TaxID=980116 RepID=A0A8H5BL13_9AGAR|nr:hypothetical protein D9611_004065 [Tulosesus angulatus]
MAKETLYCKLDDFLEHYFIAPPNPESFEKVLQSMTDKGCFIPRPNAFPKPEGTVLDKALLPGPAPANQTPTLAGQAPQASIQPNAGPQSYFPQVLKSFSQKPSQGKRLKNISEKDAFSPLEQLGKDIRDSMEDAGLAVNGFEMRMVPDNRLASDIEGCNNRIDACIRAIQIPTTLTDPAASDSKSKKSTKVPLSEIIVPFEFKLSRNDKGNAENRLQLVSAVTHLMNDDVSRDFTYGRPDLLVRVFVSLFSATREEMGYNSHITSLSDQSYLYELDHVQVQSLPHPCSEDTESIPPQVSVDKSDHRQSYFFKTTQIVSEVRSFRISGRNTRIWKAVEVVSRHDLTPKENGREIILKDAWIDDNAMDEFNLQQQLFRDIELLKQGDWESLEILKNVALSPSKKEMAQLGEYLKDDSYKSLFLRFDESVSYVSEPSKAVHQHAWNPPNIFGTVNVLAKQLDLGQSRRTGAMNTASAQRHAAQKEAPNGNPKSNFLSLSPKKRCFFVFPDTCTRVSHLPTLGVVMDVLRQAHYALLLMFCAGWVHRDISDGNILAIEVDGKWAVRLADLEYAKKVSPKIPGSPDPKTGTPYFMAYEIQVSHLISRTWAPEVEHESGLVEWGKFVDIGEGEEKCLGVVHTFFHDIESFWWLILWIITCRIAGCDASKNEVQAIFPLISTPPQPRFDVLRNGLSPSMESSLHEKVQPIADRLANFRSRIFYDLHRTTAEMRLDYSEYAPICAIPFMFFDSLEGSRDTWATLPLEPATTSITPRIAPGPQPVEVRVPRRGSKRKSVHPGDEQDEPSVTPLTLVAVDDTEDQPAPPKKTRIVPSRGKKTVGGGT